MKGPYLFQSAAARMAMTLLDGVLSSLRRSAQRHFACPPPQKLLLSQIAHLGDLILATSLLAPLKQALPHLKIGLLIGSWGREVVESHPLIDTLHIFDHWKLQRAPLSSLDKWRQHRTSFRTALKELRAESYDVAIEGRYYFPNAIPLLYRAQIPIRLGYTSGGFGPLLTHPVRWTNRNISAAAYTAILAKVVTPLDLTLFKPTLPARAPLLMPLPKKFFVLHIGSGMPSKQWPIASWRRLTELLTHNGPLLFTGRGSLEEAQIKEIIHALPNCLNLCNCLSWKETMSLIEHASLLISVDTSIGHAAAALQIPALHIYNGIHAIEEWRPLNPRAKILTRPTPEDVFDKIFTIDFLTKNHHNSRLNNKGNEIP